MIDHLQYIRDSLTNTERSQYIDAIKCLRAKPALTDRLVTPGAINRMDDFTLQHVNQTLFIHFSVSSVSLGSFIPPALQHLLIP